MKHAGQARRAALKLVFLSLPVVVALAGAAALAGFGRGMAAVIAVWVLCVLFTLRFFRDPTARTPGAPGVIVSPGHGKVDCLDRLDDLPLLGGPCHRISIFLSVLDVHVQNAPVSGRIGSVAHAPGQFLSALRTDCARFNENVLIGFESSEVIGEKIGLRLIAGVLARRIVPFVQVGDRLERGERISLIQFGSRCELYLPLRYQIKVKLGDKVVGGETIMAAR